MEILFALVAIPPWTEVGADRTKSTEGTEGEVVSSLESVETDLAPLAPTSSLGAGDAMNEPFQTSSDSSTSS